MKIQVIAIVIVTMAAMAGGCEKESPSAKPEQSRTQTDQAGPGSEAAEVIYTCPMHPNVRMHEQGSCPFCGMDLVLDDKVDEASYVVYTCPMHPDVKVHEPGSCPVCGMDLVPEDKVDKAHEHGSHTKEGMHEDQH